MSKAPRTAANTLVGWALNSGTRRVVALSAALAAPLAQGAGVFLPATGVVAPSAAASSGTAHRRVRDAFPPRLVRVVHAELERARDQAALLGSGQLLFNFGDVHLRGVIERTAPTLGGYSLSGRIDEPGGGFVTFAMHGEAVAGSIWTPDASYEIAPRGDGLHVVQPATAIECAGEVADGDALDFEHSPFVPKTGAADDGSNTVVDVLVVWTPEREEQAGGEDEARAEIDLWIAYANDAFERSGAFVSLNLVGAERVDHVQSDVVTDLYRLIDPSDGHMDDVHERRDALRADLVSLSVTTRHGVATLDGAFSVAGPSAYIFTHEVGHNFGLLHDRYDSGVVGNEYESGWVVVSGPDCHGTIMAAGFQRCDESILFNSGFGVPYFSSPLRYHGIGSPMGGWRFSGVRTTHGPADAVAALNRDRRAVAARRP